MGLDPVLPKLSVPACGAYRRIPENTEQFQRCRALNHLISEHILALNDPQHTEMQAEPGV